MTKKHDPLDTSTGRRFVDHDGMFEPRGRPRHRTEYDVQDYIDERRDALNKWADHLAVLK